MPSETRLISINRLLSLALTVGYNLSERLMLRFNIDAIGFNFGKSVNGNYINGTQGSRESASPTAFNLFRRSEYCIKIVEGKS